MPREFLERISDLLQHSPLQRADAIRLIRVDDFFQCADAPFAALAESRVSCRSFIPEQSVTDETLRCCIASAIRSPSVCNRQAWRAHVFRNRARIDTILACQEGNRGFGHLIPCLIVVTCDLRCFAGAIERYQPWIDGGIFAMSLMYALHSSRLGVVALNWSVLPSRDRQLRARSDIPAYERVIVLLGVGHPTAEFMAPASNRRDLHEVVSFDDSAPPI